MNTSRSRRKNVQQESRDDTEVRSLDGWRGRSIKLSLGEEDLDLLDNVLCVIPELRVVMRLGQEARRRGLKYPVTSAKQLTALLNRNPMEVDGHRVDAKSITHALAKEWFPIAHEGELLSAMHLAIRRCEAEGAAAFLEEIKSLKSERPKSSGGKSGR